METLTLKEKKIPVWIHYFLKFAGYYNLAWGIYILNYPLNFYQAFNPFTVQFPLLLYPFGVAVMIFGGFYLAAARKPFYYQWLIFLGLGSKLFGPLVAYFLILDSFFNQFNFLLHIVFNDLLWVIPMAVAFYIVFKESQNQESEDVASFPSVLHDFHTQDGISLAKLNQDQPILMVFLRHFGCTFCREALAGVAQQRNAIEKEGVKLVFVHMASEAEAQSYFEKYGLADVSRVSDVYCTLYRAFSLKRAKFGEVFGIKSFTRGFQAGILKRHGIGKLVGDGFRMPGVFLVHQNQILQSYRHTSAADVPDYTELATCAYVSLISKPTKNNLRE